MILTSHGHNLELAWLLADADATLGEPGASDPTIAALARHALANGYDRNYGGVFRDATDRDKEFWQNAEALVGFLEGHRVTGDDTFLEAFWHSWQFDRAHLVHPEFGEWRVRTTESGDIVDSDLGNPWKNAYHSGRAMLECARRLGTDGDEFHHLLHERMLPFWQARAIDEECGGYLTEFDGDGQRLPGDRDKYLVTQTRLVWFFSTLGDVDRARNGVDFLTEHFHDREHGGFQWRVARDGTPIDDAKLVYGQAFAVYALAAFARATSDESATQLANNTFETLLRNAADTARGGYHETFERDWTPTGDRKSLDIHLHLLEAFAELYRLTGDAVHARRLREVRELICTRMVDSATGAGGNQYDLGFRPLEPITIDRTWIAERKPRVAT